MRTRATPLNTTKPFAPLAEIPQRTDMSLYYVQKNFSINSTGTLMFAGDIIMISMV